MEAAVHVVLLRDAALDEGVVGARDLLLHVGHDSLLRQWAPGKGEEEGLAVYTKVVDVLK